MNPFREVPCGIITETVRRLFIEANTDLGADVETAVRGALATEESKLARHVLKQILENADAARQEGLPLCQDTGLACLFAEVGQDVHVVGGDFLACLQEGVRQAYGDGFLRKSVCDPLSRMNTGDNTPAVIFTEIAPGDRIRLIAMPKGGGSENMSSVTMLVPAAGLEGIRDLVVDKVRLAGPNACPPYIVGVGIGLSLDQAPILAKKALLRPVGEPNRRDPRLAELEKEILAAVNRLGIGPQGYGGRTTALAVHLEIGPCHIASLPVAVNIQCHAARHKEALI